MGYSYGFVFDKTENVRDIDRKIIMPSSWVVSAAHCEKLNFRKLALEHKLCDVHFEKDPKAMGEFVFSDFPEFIIRN